MRLTCPDGHDVVTPDLGWGLEEAPRTEGSARRELYDWCARCATHVRAAR